MLQQHARDLCNLNLKTRTLDANVHTLLAETDTVGRKAQRCKMSQLSSPETPSKNLDLRSEASQKAHNAAFHQKALILAILRGIRCTADAEALREQEREQLDPEQALRCAATMQDLPAPLPVELEAEELQRRLKKISFPVTYADGHVGKAPPH